METETVVTSNNHVISAFKDDFITKRIKKRGLYEKFTLDFIRHYLRDIDGPVIIDIGANIGNHSLDFSTYSQRVYAFEPVDFIFDVLKKNVEDNGVGNIVLTNKALSHEECAAEIFIVPHNIGASGFDERTEDAKRISVYKIVGDSFFLNQQIERIDFIKVDVEGHEEEVLRGLLETIKKFKPLIMMEWYDLEMINKINKSRFMDLLREYYDIQVLGNNRDEAFWEGKPFGRFRRKVHKLFVRQSPRLYYFDENKQYHNILLIPRH